jgi:hypothetical protein
MGIEKCSTSVLIREMQIKSTMCYYLTPVKMSIIKTTKDAKAGEDVEKRNMK